MSDRQDISRVKDSSINQAGRDLTVIYGLSAADVIAIVKETVASELAIYSQNADKKAEERLNQFSNDLAQILYEKVADKLDRFSEPSLQFAVREAALSYVKSGNASDERTLIDLMIERVKVDEHTTKQKLIDQAIRIVPTLSSECLALLSLFVFRSLTFTGDRVAYERWIDSVGPVLKGIQNVTTLDIEYLKQADCVTGMIGIMTQEDWIEACPKQNNLYFRHPVPVEAAEAFKTKYGISSYGNGFSIANSPYLSGPESIVLIAKLMDFRPDGTIRFNITHSDLVENLITGFNVLSLKGDIFDLINSSTLFSPEEVKHFFISRNPHWEKAIALMEDQKLRSLSLLPVGAYIGSRQLSILSGEEIALETFYN